MTAIDGLYRQHNDKLKLVLRARFGGLPHQSIEDAVQFAWAQLLAQPEGSIDERVFSWLYVVALREVLRHTRREGAREVALDSIAEPASGEDVDATIDARLALRAVSRAVSERQMRALMFQASGMSYAETAEATGWSLRTVERQLRHGRSRARMAVAA